MKIQDKKSNIIIGDFDLEKYLVRNIASRATALG